MNDQKMKLITRLCISLVVCFGAVNCRASDTLDINTYLDQVINHHPMIKKANAYTDIKEGYDLKSKGVLDPKVYSDLQSKQFDEKKYFTIWQSEVKVPTRFPVDFSVGYEQSDGLFLNPEGKVPTNGLVYGTIQLSLLRGLLYDEQRYDMQSMALNAAKSEIEQDLLIREVLSESIDIYLEWAAAYENVSIYKEYGELLIERHQNVINLFANGDSPEIDTVESRLSILTAEKLWLQARQKLLSTQQKLSLFLWSAEGEPLSLRAEIVPMPFSDVLIQLQNEIAFSNFNFGIDPYVQKIETEIRSLEIENKLKREQLKPRLDLKYNTILNLGADRVVPSFSLQDYKYGVSFQYPILNRKTKGELKINNALRDQKSLERTNYIGYLQRKYEALIERQSISEDLISISRQKIESSKQLYQAEQIKFDLGESSMFLLNQRERKLLEAKTEIIKHYKDLGGVMVELYYFVLGQQN